MLRAISMVSVVLMVLVAACGDDAAGDGPGASSPTTATPSTESGTETPATSSTVAGTDAPATTAAGAPSTTTSQAPTTTTATTGTSGSGRTFCEVDAEGRRIDPYRGSPAEMEADVARARELGPEFLATAPPAIEEELGIIIPIFLDVMDYIESTGFDEGAVDLGEISARFYSTDEAQEVGRAIDEWVAENC